MSGRAVDPAYGGIWRAGFPDELSRCTGFEWDAGNAEEKWELHEVH
jgi:hypothetical protein